MSETTYDLIFRGELLPEGDGSVARAELARVLKLDDTRLGQLFSGGTVYVRRGTDRDTAARFQAAFRQAGARLRVLPVEDAASAPQPQPQVQSRPVAQQGAMAPAVSPAVAVPPSQEPAHVPAQAAAALPSEDGAERPLARKLSLAERLAAQQAESQGNDAGAGEEDGRSGHDGGSGTPIEFVSDGRPVAPAAPALYPVSAASVRPQPLDDAPAFTLAPLGADLIDEDERELKGEVMVSVEHIDLAPPGGTIPVLEPRANIRPTVVIPDFDVAEAGALMAELTEFVELPLDLSAFSVAPVGARIGEPQEAPVADVRVDHLTLAPPGVNLSAPPR